VSANDDHDGICCAHDLDGEGGLARPRWGPSFGLPAGRGGPPQPSASHSRNFSSEPRS